MSKLINYICRNVEVPRLLLWLLWANLVVGVLNAMVNLRIL